MAVKIVSNSQLIVFCITFLPKIRWVSNTFHTIRLFSTNRFNLNGFSFFCFVFTISDLTTILKSLTSSDRDDECIAYALKLRSVWALGNYCKFFSLYKLAPKSARHLINWFVDRERKFALKNIIKAYVAIILILPFFNCFLISRSNWFFSFKINSYRPNFPVESVVRILAFESFEKCVEWMTPFSVAFTDNTNALIDCKTSATVAIPLIV